MRLLYYLSKLIKKIHIPAIKNSKIDKTSKVCSGSHLVDVKMGKYSYIGNFCTVVDANIGSFCSIADNCIIGGASHPLDWISTSPVFHKGRNIMHKNFSMHAYTTTQKTEIGNDVWIGNNCLIKSGINIGDGSVVGMGSIVTKDVPPYSIVSGNPAKVIRLRLNENVIEILLKTQWWEMTDNEIKELAVYITEPEKFLGRINKSNDAR